MNDLDRRIANLSPAKRALLEKKLQQKAIAERSAPTVQISIEADRYCIPLSYSQQRMWLLDRLEPGNPAYNRPANLYLSGYLDRQVLAQSLQEILRRHAVLRAKFPAVNGQPVQSIEPSVTLELPFVNLSDLPAAERDLRLQELVIRSANCCFALDRDLLVKATLVRVNKLEHVLLITFHHIIFDGWSLGIFIKELSALYRAFAAGKSSPLPALSSQYTDFALWQQQHLSPQRLQPHLNYWHKQLGGHLPILALPTDYPRPPIQTYRGAKQTLLVDTSLSNALQDLSKKEEVTLFMLLLTTFQTLLYRYTGETDLLVGCPIAGRDRVETESLIGVFINTLILRTQLDPEMNFRELLGRVRQVALDAYAHQELPFEKLIEELKPERNLSYPLLFQVMFQVRNLPKHNSIVSAIEIAEFDCDPQIAAFDLTLDITVGSAGLACVFTYNTDLFAASTIERMLGHFQTLLAGIVANPDRSISSLPLLTATEQQQIGNWQQTPADYPQVCLQQLFEAQAAKTPDAIAVVCADRQLTYRQLNHRSNQLARHLQGLGVKPDILVGIYVERSLEMLIGLLGILKAGGAYVPLDPSYPAERLSYMVKDAQIEILLTQQQLLSSLPSAATRVICLDSDWATIDRQDSANLRSQVTLAHLAYTIYTSGSTGKPKGVQICHRSVTNFLHSMRRQPGLTASDILLNVTTISFDIAVLELYLPLTVGAKIVIASREIVRDGNALLQLLAQSRATVMQATPTTWQMLIAAGWRGKSPLKILCGGEALSPDLASQLVARGESVWNLYGPTEATVWATIDRVEDPGTISIGRAIDNIQTYILDPNLQPVQIGMPGELYIGGDCLARGYLHRPDLTAAKFIANPFSTALQARLYKTGDVVKYLPDGKIEYLSRLDDLVKLRGVRIELGEIESLLATHPQMRSTVAIVREDTPGDKRLVVYFIPDRQQSPPPIRDLHDFLAQKLPRQSLPSAWVMLAEFPTTPNGKIDRRALPVPDPSARINAAHDCPAPRNAIEAQLLEIWTKVLGIAGLSIHDNFFDLGGHSLLAVNMFVEIERIWGQNLPLATLFQHQTIAELATIIAPDMADADRIEIQSPAWKSLVKIKQGSSNLPPLFFIHDVSGSILFYRQLVECMRTDRTCYVLQPLGMDGSQPPIESVSEMAANYIEEILQVQPAGPYHLSGYSFGSFVAFEIAHQLQLQGREVGLLAVIDTIAPKLLDAADRANISRSPKSHPNYSRIAKFLSLNSQERIAYIHNGLRIHRTTGKLRNPYRFYLRYIKRSLLEVGSLDVYWTNDRAFHSYAAPATYPGRVALFYSDDKLPKLAVQPALNWDKIATGGVEVQPISGSNHATIIQMPYVRALGAQLTSALDLQSRTEVKHL